MSCMLTACAMMIFGRSVDDYSDAVCLGRMIINNFFVNMYIYEDRKWDSYCMVTFSLCDGQWRFGHGGNQPAGR